MTIESWWKKQKQCKFFVFYGLQFESLLFLFVLYFFHLYFYYYSSYVFCYVRTVSVSRLFEFEPVKRNWLSPGFFHTNSTTPTPFFFICVTQLSKSDAHNVMLRSVRHDQTGSYKCEVSADAPFFDTGMVSSQMTVVGKWIPSTL